MKNKLNSRDIKRTSRGFTIVEVVIALTVIVIVSAAGMMMVQSQIKSEQKIAQTIEATNIAENAIECFRFADNNASPSLEAAFYDAFCKTGYFQHEDGRTNMPTSSDGVSTYVIYKNGLIVTINFCREKSVDGVVTQAAKIDISAENTNGDTILEKYTYTKQ